MPNEPNDWPRIAVVGAGAVGCYFGGMLARAGAPVVLIGRQQHVEAINQNGLLLDCLRFQERITVTASTDLVAARDAEVVLFCVKSSDTEATAKSLVAHLPTGAVVVSLQNGVDNAEKIRAAGLDAIPAVVYVAAQMSAPGCVKHTGRGDLVIGDLPGSQHDAETSRRRLAKLPAWFTRADIPCVVSDNIQSELWTKLIINCAFNAISALGRAQYRQIVANSHTRALMIQTVEEAAAVAKAAGVQFAQPDLVATTLAIGESMAGATSSTAQDIARGKRTEIDALNGYVARLGSELGVSTPLNGTLHALVKLLEEEK